MSEQPERLMAIDGNSLLYRAFFAMKYLSTSEGFPTNALYGLTAMLLKVLEEKPDYIAVAFDTPKPTFRHQEYDGYKAQRKPPPDALKEQAPVARELIRAFNIPVIEMPGYEADDIIGAMAALACQKGLRATIVTGDLDALQLVNDCVSVMTTVKGVTDTVTYDPAAVIDRYGIRPEQMPDFKGLKGDASDNIPGVPGIGDKTAAALITQFGTIENLLGRLSELPEGRVRTALEQNAELARLSKRLATIVCDLPEPLDLGQYRAKEPDYDALRDLFVRLEFKTMLQRLPEVTSAEGKAAPEERVELGACRRIDSAEQLRDLLKSLEDAGGFSLQCSTSSGKAAEAEIQGVSFCVCSGDTAYVEVNAPPTSESLELDFGRRYSADLTDLAGLLESERLPKCCHDLKLNYAALLRRGILLRGVTFDTMLGAYVLDSSRSSFAIGDVAFEQLSLELPGVTRKSGEVEIDPVTLTCGEAEAACRLRDTIEKRLEADGMMDLYNDVELPLAPILARMELAGVAVDVEQLGALSTTLEVEMRGLEQSIYELAGGEFNIGSTRQLQTVLFEKLGLSTARKTKTGYSTSAETLEMLTEQHPIADLILRYREITKIKSTYADSLPRLINPGTGRIHTSLNQAVTATGRLSSSDPNLQNIPIRTELGREIRKAFIASPGSLLLSADYSQIELRILAHVTRDENLVYAFEHDEDIHTATACTLFGVEVADVNPEMRGRAKTVNFAVIYGMSDFSLGRSLGLPVKEAREFIQRYFARFPGVRRYTDDTIASAREMGYVSTPLGRRRYIPEIHSSNRNIRLFAERAAVNMPIQGMAADIMKLAMINVAKSLDSGDTGASMLLQVHDELLFELPTDRLADVAAAVKDAMEGACELSVPLRVDVKAGPNWAEMDAVAPGR